MNVDDLLEGMDDPDERARLRRVHELLLSVEPPPEPAPPLRALPRRRRYLPALLAAALAVAAFGAGYVLGDRSADVEAIRVLPLAGVGEARAASASIELLPEDASGNWPLKVLLRGLEPSRDRQDFYELWLTKDGKLAASCGRFTVHPGLTVVTLSVPYGLRQFDGWVVTRRGSDQPLLTT